MKTDTSKLRVALDALRPIFKTRNTLPILYCVKLFTESNRLHIAATNLDEYAVEKIEADGEFGPVCVSFNHLSLALSGSETEIVIDGNSAKIICGDNQTIISTLDDDEFPKLPRFDDSQTHGVACTEAARAIGLVSWAASDDKGRYLINSVLIASESAKLTAVATNGRELAIAEVACIGSDFEVVIPSEFVSNASTALNRKGASLASNRNQIRVTHESGVYFCKQIDGLYPNYKNAIPKDVKPLGTVLVAEFKSTIAGCCGFSSDSEAKGLFSFSKKEVMVELIGDLNSQVARHMLGKFDNFTVALSTKKMLKIFQNLKSEEAKLFYVDDKTPIRIEAGDLTVIECPMRK